MRNSKTIPKTYRNRFSEEERKKKNIIWDVLCREWFQRYVDPFRDTVLDVAAGYGEFINHIRAKKKIAADINDDIRNHVDRDVRVVTADAKHMKQIKGASVDVVFMSNFLEHLASTDEMLSVLSECRRVLKKKGRILILQPNIYYIKEAYWFFIDHHTPVTHESLREALEISGFTVTELLPRFLPYTTKSRFPQHPFFVRLYLKMPFLFPLLGKQIFAVAQK